MVSAANAAAAAAAAAAAGARMSIPSAIRVCCFSATATRYCHTPWSSCHDAPGLIQRWPRSGFGCEQRRQHRQTGLRTGTRRMWMLFRVNWGRCCCPSLWTNYLPLQLLLLRSLHSVSCQQRCCQCRSHLTSRGLSSTRCVSWHAS